MDSISEQVAANTESIVEIKKQLATYNDSAVQTKSIIAQVDELNTRCKSIKESNCKLITKETPPSRFPNETDEGGIFFKFYRQSHPIQNLPMID